MSTPCVEIPTPDESTRIRKSTNEKRRLNEEHYDRRQALDPVPIEREGGKIYAGNDEYQVVEDPDEVAEIVSEQNKISKMVGETSREYKAQLSKQEKKEFEAAWNVLAGELGEDEVVRVASVALDLSSQGIRIGKHGLDSLWEDSEGNLVVVDSKFTENKDGTQSLETSERYGKQLCDDWLLRKAKQMQNPASALYSEENAIAGERIEQELPNIRRILVHGHPSTENITISEGRYGSEEFEQKVVLKRSRDFEGGF